MSNSLMRSSQNSMVGGVCAGVAEKYNLEVSLVRVATAIAALSAIGSWVIPLYIIGWAVLPVKGAAPKPPKFTSQVQEARIVTEPGHTAQTTAPQGTPSSPWEQPYQPQQQTGSVWQQPYQGRQQ